MKQSWLAYFRANQGEPQEIPWSEVEPPAAEVARFLIPSLQQFQLGEGARGITFLTLGRRHAEASGNLDFVETLALFIGEEQRHSAMLARYLRAVGAPILERHWVDSIFRKMRKFAGLECMVTVLVTAELFAIPYYRSVMRLSNCSALRALCRRILREEAQHLLFQASTLRSLQSKRSAAWIRLTHLAQWVLMSATGLAVWLGHREVLKRGGVDFLRFALECRALLRHLQRLSGKAGQPMKWPVAPSVPSSSGVESPRYL